MVLLFFSALYLCLRGFKLDEGKGWVLLLEAGGFVRIQAGLGPRVKGEGMIRGQEISIHSRSKQEI